MTIPRDRASIVWRAAAAGLLLGIAACASDGPSRQEQALLRDFAATSYGAGEHSAFTTASSTWVRSVEQSIRVVIARPDRSATTPVVVYLPGLGESCEAGERWRAAWAAAGYAVVSVQLLDDDANAFRSELAREGDFKKLGRQHYDAGAVRRRMQLLADLVAEGKRRASARDGPWRQLDWGNLSVAGFDLGAYTALVAAGERVRGAEDAAGSLQIRAAIALSPYASAAEGAADDRYRGIQVPVISITSDMDTDPLGLVEGARLRRTPYTRMEGPDKYLLSLRGLPHGGLGGNAASTSKPSDVAPRHPQGANSDSGPTQRRARRGTGTADGPDAERDRAGSGARARGAVDLSATAVQMRIIATQAVSTAFLDAYLKNDPRARAWLASDAPAWLDAVGQLQRK
jgi:dienelactone hydrolase